MQAIPVRQAAGQVLVAGFPAQDAPLAELEQEQLGGVVLFRRNVVPPAELVALVTRITDACPRSCPPLVAVDQEGGRVARFGSPIMRLPPMRRFGEIDDPGLTERAARIVGTQLRALGLTMDFAPVLDVDTNPQNPVIGDRSFGRDVDVVTRHGLAFARGLARSGLLSCAKHFPGHGDTERDSHLELPRLAHTRERLDRIELPPFRAAAGVIPAVMTAHVVFDTLDPGVPATLSQRAITGLLREELGWDGVVLSDDLEMQAISAGWGLADAATRAIEAGCDGLLFCSRLDACHEAREALIRAAEASSRFAARLRQAATRMLDLRKRVPPAPLTDARRRADAMQPPELAEVRTALELHVE